MAMQGSEGSAAKDELKTQFMTREGNYRLLTLSEYSRPNRVGYTSNQGNVPVRVSFVNLPDPTGDGDRICFNFGRELYLYHYRGVRKAADLSKPIDKRVYKGTNPTCHDFNQATATHDSVSLLVGFSAGQLQLIDPVKKELSKLFNEERLIDRTKVTCVKWVPGSPNLFLSSHGSGQLYVYNSDLPCPATAPHYQLFKQGDGFAIYMCKAKSTRNPLYRWVVGDGAINEFAFSPCGSYLAIVSQDGLLRVFSYHTMDLLGVARSYFGGLLCVGWSHDGRYIVVGGEDDLVTVWSFHDRRVVARGHGHRSWVNMVSFDPDNTIYRDSGGGGGGGTPDTNGVVTVPHSAGDLISNCVSSPVKTSASNCVSVAVSSDKSAGGNATTTMAAVGDAICYRFGSVGQDTQLCLWDLTEEVLRRPLVKSRANTMSSGSHHTSPVPPIGKTILATGGGINSRSNTNSLTKYHDNLVGSGAPPPTTVGPPARLLHCNNLGSGGGVGVGAAVPVANEKSAVLDGVAVPPVANTTSNSSSVSAVTLSQRLAGLSFSDKSKDKSGDHHSHKRNFSLVNRSSSDKGPSSGAGAATANSNSNAKSNHVSAASKNGSASSPHTNPTSLIGSQACPRLDECPMLEALVCKKIAHERLTALAFRDDCIVTACQDGYVCTWARPGKFHGQQQQQSGVSVMECGSATAIGGGGGVSLCNSGGLSNSWRGSGAASDGGGGGAARLMAGGGGGGATIAQRGMAGADDITSIDATGAATRTFSNKADDIVENGGLIMPSTKVSSLLSGSSGVAGPPLCADTGGTVV